MPCLLAWALGSGSTASVPAGLKLQHGRKKVDAKHPGFPKPTIHNTLPEDVAGLAAWLASDRAGFITGQNFVADGGMTRKMIYKE